SICDLVVREGRVEHTEAVVMFGREYHVLLAGSAGQGDEGMRVEVGRIESLRKFSVLCLPNTAGGWLHNGPRSLHACERVRSPVNEHSEFCISIPCLSPLSGAESQSETRR